MSTLKFSRLILLSGICFYFTSCGNNTSTSEQTKTDSSSAASTTTPNTTASTSTIVATPQNMMVIIHKVANYNKWKMAYDVHDTARQSNGIHNYIIGRGILDSNMVLVAMKVDDTAKAMTFSKAPQLKQAMSKAGVTGTPKVDMYTAVYQDTATIDSKLRSRVTFTVKDWDKWLMKFQEGANDRTNNGIALRSYGHAANDTKKVTVVTALLDSAKAMAYYKSDALKKRMDSSGVIGKPDRFIFRVVKKY